MTALFCSRCDAKFASIGEVPASCPVCLKPTRWRTMPPIAGEPRVPWHLTRDDRLFLTALRIQRDA